MGDEPGVDPDAMWKPGYFAPTGDRTPDEHDVTEGSREWFADYGRRAAPVAADPAPRLDGLAVADPAATPRPTSHIARDTAGDMARGPEASNAPARDRTARRRLVGALTIAAFGVGGVAWQASHDDPAGGGHRLASIPTRAVPAWIAELDTGHVTGIIGNQSTIVVLELVTNDLVGLDTTSGAEQWRVTVAPSRSIARLEEADGAAIVLVEESAGDRSIAAYDLDSGAQLWREEGFGRSTFVTFQGNIYRLPGGVTNVAIELLDPRTGVELDALSSPLASVGWAHASTAHDDLVEVFDLQNLERVAGPIPIGDVVAASATGGHVVGLGRDAIIRLYGSTGDQLSSLQTTVDRPEQFDVTDTPEPMLLVMADREIIGYSLSGDRISQAWRTGQVQVYEIADVGEHTYAVVQSVVAAGPHGGPVRVVDAMTGEAVAAPRDGSSVRLGRDGFVVEITDDEGVRLAIEGYGYDGVRQWRFDLAREQQGLFLVDGGMVVVASDPTAQTSTLTYLN